MSIEHNLSLIERYYAEAVSAATAADFFTVRGGRVAELRRFLDFESFGKQLE